MLFNSFEFLLGFMPAVVALVALLHRTGNGDRIPLVLLIGSLFFYGWWDWRYVPLLGASILFNFMIGRAVVSRAETPAGLRIMAFGIVANLSALGFFKYAGFLTAVVEGAAGSTFDVKSLVLPLGISFFTFTQITYLVDAYQGEAKDYGPIDYALFVTYFPHLIAGPILHHKEMMPQFAAIRARGFLADDIAIGLSIFALGLFKKVGLADSIGAFAKDVFDAAKIEGGRMTFIEAWGGAVAYTLQLYFDFSGYSDMAMGLSRIFGVNLPFNFASPYKATSIIDFWRRWHISLTRILTSYVYNPIMLGLTRRRMAQGLSGIKRGVAEDGAAFVWLVAFPTLFTMTVAGIWHGAGWQFAIFGALHGAYLVVNHAWRMVKHRLGWAKQSSGPATRWLSRLATFVAVVAAFVFFRADTMDAAWRLLAAMAGQSGIVLPQGAVRLLGPVVPLLSELGVGVGQYDALQFSGAQALLTGLLLAIVWLAPGTQELMHAVMPLPKILGDTIASSRRWRATAAWAFAVGAALALSLPFIMLNRSEFLYFQF